MISSTPVPAARPAGPRVLLLTTDPAEADRLAEAIARQLGEAVLTETCLTFDEARECLDHCECLGIATRVALPDVVGERLYHRLRQLAPKTPIVTLAASEERRLANRMSDLGTDDSHVGDRIDADAVARSLSFSLERAKREKAERELSAAKALQQALYPKAGPILPGYDIAGAAFPAEQNCGDYFDFFPLVNDSVGLVVGDVSGHGLAPALFMLQTRAYLRSLADFWYFLDLLNGPELTVGEVLTHVNRHLCQADGEHFVSVFFAQLEPRTRRLTYSAGGHRGYLMHADGSWEPLESTGMLIGMLPGIDIPAAPTFELQPGDLVFVPTDGIEEAANAEGEQFGVERMMETVARMKELPAEQIVRNLHTIVSEFRGNKPLLDDVTAIVLKVGE